MYSTRPIYLALLPMLLGSMSHADDFALRLEAGKTAAVASFEGRQYHRTINTWLHPVLQSCLPKDGSVMIGSFEMVADISTIGRVSGLVVNSQTEAAYCLGKKLVHARLPEPPAAPFPLALTVVFPTDPPCPAIKTAAYSAPGSASASACQ